MITADSTASLGPHAAGDPTAMHSTTVWPRGDRVRIRAAGVFVTRSETSSVLDIILSIWPVCTRAPSVFFRRDGALYPWSIVARGSPQSVAVTAPGQLLGEIFLAPNGERLAFVSGRRRAPAGQIYVLVGGGRLVRGVDLPGEMPATGWPVGLEFADGGARLRFGLGDAAGAARCGLVVTFEPEPMEGPVMPVAADYPEACGGVKLQDQR